MAQFRGKFSVFALFLCFLILNGCAMFHPSHARLCSQIKSDIMLNNGRDMNPNTAFREKSELPRLSKAYHDENC